MSTQPTPAELAAYEWIRQRVTKGYWAAVLFSAGMAVFIWLALGPSHPLNAVTVTGATLVLGFGVAAPVMRRMPRHWFRVPAGERVLHRMLGVDIFRWLLERSGWERYVHSVSSIPRGLAYPASKWGCEAMYARMEPALPSTSCWRRSHWPPATGGAQSGYCWRVCPFISTPCCFNAPSGFDSSLCWISPVLEYR